MVIADNKKECHDMKLEDFAPDVQCMIRKIHAQFSNYKEPDGSGRPITVAGTIENLKKNMLPTKQKAMLFRRPENCLLRINWAMHRGSAVRFFADK